MSAKIKRTLLATGALVAGLSLIGGAVILDLLRRARATIESHEARLRVDVETLRQRYPAPEILGELDPSLSALKDYRCPLAQWEGPGGPYLRYEQGHSGEIRALKDALRSGIGYPSRRIYVDEPFTAIAMTQHVFREGGYASACRRYVDTQESLRSHLPEALSHPDLEIEEVRWLARALDQLISARPAKEDVIAAEFALDRAEILKVLRNRPDARRLFSQPPGWRELFSWNVLVAKTLCRLDEHYREALVYCSVPTSRWQSIREAYFARAPEPGLTWSVLRSGAFEALYLEQEGLDHWRRLRILTSITLFTLEQGCEPETLSDLVPAYLEAIPASPWGERPYQYKEGESGCRLPRFGIH